MEWYIINTINISIAAKENAGQDEEFTVLVQVTTVPVIVTTGQAKSLYNAAEIASKSILHTFQILLIHNQNNDEEAGQSTLVNY